MTTKGILQAFIQKSPDRGQLKELAQLLKGWWLGYNHFTPIVETRRAEAQDRDSASLQPVSFSLA